jgi:hypothetical protein
MVNNKLIDIVGLGKYHENLKGVLSKKQDVIEDLQTIIEGAAAGATALDEAKSYVDGKVDGKFDAAGAAAQALADAKADAAEKYQVKGDYATVAQVNAKQDTITDLETIRSGAAKGATALQESDLVFATDGEIDALFE